MTRKLLTVTRKINELLPLDGSIIVAIDGNCGAGKSTLAENISRMYDCNIFHMDDFFLRPGQRTPERYAEPGGNVDYERFKDEVLTPLKKEISFSYSPFNCAALSFDAPVSVRTKKINIIEGAYSLHPYFENPYTLRFFLSASPMLQKQRILKRPAHLHERFFNEWIPMENRYFEKFKIREKAITL